MDNDVLMTIDRDGRYSSCITVDGKSYVLQDYDGSLTIKGATLSGRSLEKYNRQFVKEAINAILDGNIDRVRTLYDTTRDMIESALIPVDSFKRRDTLNMTLNEYETKKKSGNGSPSACYEVALASDRELQKGDVVEYYIKEPPMVKKEYKTKPDKWVRQKLKNYEKATPIEHYDFDLDKDHYIERLDKTTIKFLGVIGWDRFKEMFPEIKLLKSEKRKMIPIMGVEAFSEKFPKYKWGKVDLKRLEGSDLELAQSKINKQTR